jgi:hypothetical protein
MSKKMEKGPPLFANHGEFYFGQPQQIVFDWISCSIHSKLAI